MSFPRRYRPRPWSPLSDAEYAVLAPYLGRPATAPGRRLADPRGRLDAIFRICLTNTPWSRISTDHGPTATIHRHFRRLARAGVWAALLRNSVRRRSPPALRGLKDWIAAVFRRCLRMLGLAAIILARRLHLHRALPGPSWYFPHPDLSELVRSVANGALERRDDPAQEALLRCCRAVLRVTEGRRSVPRCLVPVG